MAFSDDDKKILSNNGWRPSAYDKDTYLRNGQRIVGDRDNSWNQVGSGRLTNGTDAEKDRRSK